MPPLETTIRQRLRKIQALATSGSPGERENAARILGELCRKHNIQPDDLLSETTSPVVFTVRDKTQGELLTQCAIAACGTHTITNIVKGRSHTYWLTAAQAIDVRECFAHHLPRLKAHLEEAFAAYIYRNKLHGTHEPATEEPAKNLTPEEIAQLKRIAVMMLHMPPSTWVKTHKIEPAPEKPQP